MTKFQPGDAVRKHDGQFVFVVEWTHADGVTIAKSRLGELPASTDLSTRGKVKEEDLEFADPVLQFFTWAHLPERLQSVSAPFGRLAHQIALTLPSNEQRNIALQDLLRAKDAAVRARIWE